MKFQCPTCKLSGKIDDSKIVAGAAISAKCPKCNNVFSINENIMFDIVEVVPQNLDLTEYFSCPKCNKTQLKSDTCISCGVIFSKLRTEPNVIQMNEKQVHKTLESGNDFIPDLLFLGDLVYLYGSSKINQTLELSGNESEIGRITNYTVINFRENGLAIKIIKSGALNNFYTAIRFDNISRVSIEDKKVLSVDTNKSVIGRAVVGGLVLGPLAAIIGGMSGIGVKKLEYDILLSIFFSDTSNNTGCLVFMAKYEKRSDIIKYFKTYIPQKLIIGELTEEYAS